MSMTFCHLKIYIFLEISILSPFSVVFGRFVVHPAYIYIVIFVHLFDSILSQIPIKYHNSYIFDVLRNLVTLLYSHGCTNSYRFTPVDVRTIVFYCVTIM